jgi:hypothetical protein
MTQHRGDLGGAIARCGLCLVLLTSMARAVVGNNGAPTASPTTQASSANVRFQAVNTGTTVFVIDTPRTVVMSFDTEYSAIDATKWRRSLDLLLSANADIDASAIERVTVYPAAHNTGAVSIVLAGSTDADRVKLALENSTFPLFVSGTRHTGSLFGHVASGVLAIATAAPTPPGSADDSSSTDSFIPDWFLIIACVALVALVVIVSCVAYVELRRGKRSKTWASTKHQDEEWGGAEEEQAAESTRGKTALMVALGRPGERRGNARDEATRLSDADRTQLDRAQRPFSAYSVHSDRQIQRSQSPVRLLHSSLDNHDTPNAAEKRWVGAAGTESFERSRATLFPKMKSGTPRLSDGSINNESPSAWQHRSRTVEGIDLDAEVTDDAPSPQQGSTLQRRTTHAL